MTVFGHKPTLVATRRRHIIVMYAWAHYWLEIIALLSRAAPLDRAVWCVASDSSRK